MSSIKLSTRVARRARRFLCLFPKMNDGIGRNGYDAMADSRLTAGGNRQKHKIGESTSLGTTSELSNGYTETNNDRFLPYNAVDTPATTRDSTRMTSASISRGMRGKRPRSVLKSRGKVQAECLSWSSQNMHL